MTTGLLTTTAGRNAIIADLGGGADLVLTHVAWGDANGVPYNPNEAQVALVNEKYRATIASVAVVAGAIVVDAVIPADTPDGSARPSHGFNVAEVGLFNAAGTLIGVARCGNGYKPPPSSGQAHDVTYRLKLAVANPSAITVVIDPVAQVNIGRHVRPFWLTVDGVENAPPGAPVFGATYIIGAAPTGAWTGFAHRLAQWVGVWALAAAPEGHIVCDQSADEANALRFLKRTATGWGSAAATETAFGFARRATADEVTARSDVPAFVSPEHVPDGFNLVVVTFDSSGSWTVPAGVKYAFIECWGAGGGGGAGDNSTLGGYGGGGGAYAAAYKAVTPGQTHTITVGTGGASSNAGGNSGLAGGTTSCGALISAGGGAGGGNASLSPGAGGTSASGAQIVVPGGGAFVRMASGIGTPGGNGANGAQGGQQGNSGSQPGGGAAGNSYNNFYSGQKGGNGRVQITYAAPIAP
jgi:hypothetical protein